jgi:hypothetical protein
MPRPERGFADLPAAAQWLALTLLSVALYGLVEALHLPAALLVGPMLAAIAVGTLGGSPRVPSKLLIAAQGIVGCMIGSAIPLSFAAEIAKDWPIFALGVVAVLLATTLMGVAMTRMQILPGTTAIWGTSAGGSTSMILMSEAYGGDMRLVALMQNLRIFCVTLAAMLVAKLWLGATGVPAAPPVVWFPPLALVPFLATLAIAFGAAGLALALRIPAGAMLLPMAGVIALRETTGIAAELPPWLLAVTYAAVGWSVGLRFNRPILAHAFRALPAILGSIAVLILVCGAVAALLVVAAGVDPLTAYLATSPGGVDSVAIIAAASNVEMRFVMAMQTTRLVTVIVTAPGISRWLARREGAGKA